MTKYSAHAMTLRFIISELDVARVDLAPAGVARSPSRSEQAHKCFDDQRSGKSMARKSQTRILKNRTQPEEETCSLSAGKLRSLRNALRHLYRRQFALVRGQSASTTGSSGSLNH
jgi:hypothetical protein